MGNKSEVIVINKTFINDKIYFVRNREVMLDSDLAEIYGYETKYLNRQVKNNSEKFEDEDFMFQLTDDEVEEILRCKKCTSIQMGKNRGGRRYNPFVFTEQGIYMLMTVLRGELAVRQSKALIRAFKEMKDYINHSKPNSISNDLLKLSVQTNENLSRIQKIENNMITKQELNKLLKTYVNTKIRNEYLIFNGKAVEADMAYTQIYQLAKKTIYTVDNYIGLKTLTLLKNIQDNVKVILFSDNIYHGLHKTELNDFMKEYPDIDISLKKTCGVYHDRYIILDYKLKSEKIYHCGASSKDAGKKITTITEVQDKKMYYKMINSLLNNPKLVI